MKSSRRAWRGVVRRAPVWENQLHVMERRGQRAGEEAELMCRTARHMSDSHLADLLLASCEPSRCIRIAADLLSLPLQLLGITVACAQQPLPSHFSRRNVQLTFQDGKIKADRLCWSLKLGGRGWLGGRGVAAEWTTRYGIAAAGRIPASGYCSDRRRPKTERAILPFAKIGAFQNESAGVTRLHAFPAKSPVSFWMLR